MANKKPIETYDDLEREHIASKDINVNDIIILTKTYPNDADLGREVRKLITNKNGQCSILYKRTKA